MVSIQRRNLTQRATVDPRVSFDVTTPGLNVVSRTTDPMVFNAGGGSKAERLAQSLGVFRGALPSVGQALETGYKREYGQGALSALGGEDKPSQGLARIQGWETMKGENTAQQEYKAEVNQFFNDNHQVMDPQEFEEGLGEISQRYLQGSTNNFIQGFLPNAVNIETKAFEDYVRYQQEAINRDTVGFINSKAQDDTVGFIDTILDGYFEGYSLETLRDDLEVYSAFTSGDYGDILAPLIRQSLSEAQARGKQMGLNRHEVSRLYLERVGQIAIEYGLPELLDFAYVKDESNISLVDTKGNEGIPLARRPEGDRADNLRLSAYSKSSSILKEYEDMLSEEQRLALKEQEEALESAQQDIRLKVKETLAYGTPEEALSYYNFLKSTPEYFAMSGSELSSIAESLIDHASKDVIFQTGPSKQVAIQYFATRRYNNGLVLEDILEYASLLNPEDYNQLMKEFYAQEERLIALGQAQEALLAKQIQEDEEADGEALLGEIVIALSDIEMETDTLIQRDTARELRENFLSDPRFQYLSPEKRKEYLGNITKVASLDLEYDPVGNTRLFTVLRDRARLNNLEWDEIDNIIETREYEGESLEKTLSASQAETLTDIITDNKIQAIKDYEAQVKEDKRLAEERQEQIDKDIRDKAERDAKLAKTNSKNEIDDMMRVARGVTDNEQELRDIETLIRQYADTHEYSYEERKRLLDEVQEVRDNRGKFPTDGDMETYDRLRHSASQGTLTSEALRSATREGLLSQANYNTLSTLLDQQTERNQTDLSGFYTKAINTMERQLIERIVGRDNLGLITGDAVITETALMAQLTDRRIKFQEENGRDFNYDEWWTSAKEVYTQYITLDELLNLNVVDKEPLIDIGGGETVPATQVDSNEAHERANPERSRGQRFLDFFRGTPEPDTSWVIPYDTFATEVKRQEVGLPEVRDFAEFQGLGEEATKAYMYTLATEHAFTWFSNNGINEETIQELEDYLRDAGLSNDEILTVSNRARQELGQ